MATSKQTFECFVCKNNGFSGTMVYLAGKDDRGHAIRLESDGVTPHTHKTKVPSQQQQRQQSQGSTAVVTESPTTTTTTSLKIINAKLDRIIALLTGSPQTNKS
jgi:hypothetical protein